MPVRRRTILVFIAIVAVLGLAAISLSYAFGAPSASTGTTLRVQLVRPNGMHVTDVDSRAVISLSGTAPRYYRYAGAAYRHDAGRDWAGNIVGGVATFPHLPSGTWVVSVEVSHAYGYSIRNLLKPPRNGTLDVALPLVRGATVTGRVVTPTGAPAPGIVVASVDPTGHIVHRSTTDKHGDYHLAGLDSGRWRIQFNSKPFGEIIPSADYGWSYWHGEGTFASAGVLSVHSENRKSRETRLTGIDGTLPSGALVTVNRWTPGPLADYSTDTIDFIGGHGSDNILAKLRGGRTTTARLAGGSYLLRVIRPGPTSLESIAYWYAGNGKPAVRTKAQAVPLVVPANGTVSVDFGVPQR